MNVGGHRRLRPSLLAQELDPYGVVNVGAAGTFVVLKPVARATFVAELRKRLPYAAEVITCGAREILALAEEAALRPKRLRLAVTPFVSILAKAPRSTPALPIQLPAEGEWCVRVLAVKGRFVLGEYRRTMKTISCLGQIDRIFGSRATTRNWRTIAAVVHVLRKEQ